jgi:cysteine desulfurase
MRIYLDHNATTPPAEAVVEAVTRAMRDLVGNGSSVHSFGQQAKGAIDGARTSVAALVGGDPAEIVFTAGGTESINLAIRGAAEALEPTGRRGIVVSGIEHEAVLQTSRALARRGWTLTVVPVESNGVVSPEAVREALSDTTALVSVMHANNEVGTIQPVASIAALAHERGALMHTDAVQSAGKIPVSARALGVDLLSISAHKFYGPKGIGALWVRRGLRLTPQMTGGRQERSRRAGTENVPALVGLGVAARLALAALDAYQLRMGALRDRLESGVLRGVPHTAVNGTPGERVPNTTNISFERVEAESLLIALDLEGIAVSTGSACSSGTLEPSHVLKAMGLGSARAQSSLRFSLGAANTEAEIERVVTVLPGLVQKLRALTRAAVGA